MPRPARPLWVPRTYARRRHRSWMLSMTLASLGWGTWWVLFLVHRLAPGFHVDLAVPSAVSLVFAALGFLVAVLTLRARRSWLLFAHIPLLANAALFLMPWFAAEMWSP
ncbi:MAG: hypothetical protein AB1726_11000 [Planctomycetota bacterium]